MNRKAEPDPACSENPLPVHYTLSNDEIRDLYIEYYPIAEKIARSLRCSKEDAQDLAQRAMCKAFIEGKCKHFLGFKSWLRTTIRRDFLNMKRQDRFIARSLDQEAYNESESSNPTVAETDQNLCVDPCFILFENTDLTERYTQVKLTEREIHIIEMRFLDDMSVTNIAVMMGLTPKKVSKIINKAKTKLRKS